MRTFYLMIVLAGGMTLAPARLLGGDPRESSEAKRIAGLNAQLGDDEFVRRQEASRKLEEADEPARAGLEKAAAENPDAEIRARVRMPLRPLEARLSAPKGFVALFNAGDLKGWQVFRSAQGGTLRTSGEGPGWLFTDKEVTDFELRPGCSVSAGGSSGVAFRSTRRHGPSSDGPEVQVPDDDAMSCGDPRAGRSSGVLSGLVGPPGRVTRPAGRWNKMRILVRGRKVVVHVNEIKVVAADPDDYRDQARASPGLLPRKGHIGLQSHMGQVEFRRIAVKEL